jgi:AraC-like DNA-binding protein
MQTLVRGRSESSSETWKALAAVSRREFYEGDMESVSADAGGFCISKALGHPIPLTHVVSRSELAYRRSWQHIRNNKVGLRVLWIVKRGFLSIVRSEGSSELHVGEAAIVNSNRPFLITVHGREDAPFESYQAVLPPDLFLTHFRGVDEFVEPFSLKTPEGKVVLRLLDTLVELGDQIGHTTAKFLVQSFLEAIGECIGRRDLAAPRRLSLMERRMADIEEFITMNSTDPGLSHDKVAAHCGISVRYLFYLMKAHGTSFSQLLWKNRLPKAREYLISPTMHDYSIQEIAMMSGFKSAAHFSRAFKEAFSCTPSEFRTRS